MTEVGRGAVSPLFCAPVLRPGSSVLKRFSQAAGGSTLGIAANRTGTPQAVRAVADKFTYRSMHYTHGAGDVSGVKFTDVGWYYNASLIPTDSDTYTIKRWVEYPAGVYTPVTWGGSLTGTVPAGGQLESDAGISIPKDTQFWVWTEIQGAVSNMPYDSLSGTPSSLGTGEGSHTSFDGAGTISTNNSSEWFCPAAIQGTIAAANARSFCLLGDSICSGSADGGVGVRGGGGFLARLMDAKGFSYFKIARSGIRAVEFASNQQKLRTLINTLGFSDAIVQCGINDLSNGGRSNAQILANHQTIYSLFPLRRVYQTTLTPRSTSGNGWVDVAGQTRAVDGNMDFHDELNDSIRALPANLYGILEAADAAMSARNSVLWKAPPVPTTDGTHPNTYMQGFIAAALGAQLDLPGVGVAVPATPVIAVSFPWIFRHRFEGADGATTFGNDEIGGKVVTASGDAKLTTTGPLQGISSLTLDGTGDGAASPDHTDWFFGTNRFAMAVRCKASAIGNTVNTILSQFTDTPGGRAWRLYASNTGALVFGWTTDGSTNVSITSPGSTFFTGGDAEILVTRDTDNYIRIWQGRPGNFASLVAKSGSPITGSLANVAQSMRIGLALNSGFTAANPWTGLIDDVRICNGDAPSFQDPIGYLVAA